MSQINETAIKTPGVYTTEIPSFPPSVAQVATAVPAFIGYTEKAIDEDGVDLTNVPTKIHSLNDYEQYFGKAVNETSIEVKVIKATKKETNKIKTMSISAKAANDSPSPNNMYYALRLYFDNGGGPCYIVSIGKTPSIISDNDLMNGLEKLKAYDEPTLIVFPEGQSLSQDDYYKLIGMAIDQCSKLQDRFTLVDVYGTEKTTDSNMTAFRNGFKKTDNLNYAAAYYPNLKTNYDFQYKEEDVDVIIVQNVVNDFADSNTYAKDDLVRSEEKIYESLKNNNKGHDLSENTWWKEISISVYNGTDEYNKDDLVTINGKIYESLKGNNKGNAITDNTWWKEVTIGEYIGATTYAKNDLVKSGVKIFISLQDSNKGHNFNENDWWKEITSVEAYNGATTYNKDDLVKIGREVFTSLQNNNTGHDVNNISWWAYLGSAGQDGDVASWKLMLNEVSDSQKAIYYSCIDAIRKLSPTMPPASAVSGIYAKTDAQRGVWKAPANVSVSGIYDVTDFITDEEQEGMNYDVTAGKSVNAIRPFTGKGILVWGARTLDGNSNDWRFVSVRRFFIMVEESCKKATFPFVFEPNDANTWVKVRAMLENYLTILWRQGALAGAKPEHAFYVKCGLGQTMTAQDILEGRLIVELGLAAVRPAEFIILRFTHKMQES